VEPDPTPTSPSPAPPASPGAASAADTAAAEAAGGFAAATVAELKRVVWPSRQQLFSESVAVILMVSLSAAAIAAIDRFYGWAATMVFR
jgi:preprotein translocase subunit SecE